MKLAAFVVGLGLAVVLTFAGGSASAQTKNSQNTVKSNDPVVKVQAGDSLSAIADAYHTTYVRIYDDNSFIKDPDLIHPGDEVKIPASDEKLPNRPLPQAAVAAQPVPQAAYTPPVTQSAPAAAAPVQTAPVVQSAPVSGCGDNSYANFIYSHESGCRTTAMSPNGCYGIGQACPASKIYYCGADYACQNAYFTAYAGKYGGWAGAYAFWVAHGWW